MKISDMIFMSLESLWKRKVRTILTVLGVIIGTISVVVMISIGIGMQKSQIDSIKEYGNIRMIQVYGSSSKNLDDAFLEEIKSYEHVETVIPELKVDVVVKYGNYINNTYMVGVPDEFYEVSEYEFAEGGKPDSTTEMQLVYGCTVLASFYNEKTGEWPYYVNNEPVDVNLMKDAVSYKFGSSYNDDTSTENTTKTDKKYMFKSVGLQKGSLDDYKNGSNNIYVNIDALKTFLQKEFKGKAIPGQPLKENGKAYNELFYEELCVYVDDINNVMDVKQLIDDAGYYTSAPAEWIEQTKESMKTTQMTLGGIGAVSLIVAAIGIINTMMMSIYERTKEIGIMKVIGCSIPNIQTLFLIEAAFIGFIGGTVGVALSYAVSAVVNSVMSDPSMTYSEMSIIPVWLAALAIVFAIIIATLAGLIPSMRAIKISPLEAMRT